MVSISIVENLPVDLIDLESYFCSKYYITSYEDRNHNFTITLKSNIDSDLELTYVFRDTFGGSYMKSRPQVDTNDRFVFCTMYTKGVSRNRHLYRILMFDLKTSSTFCYKGKLNDTERCEILQTGFDDTNFVVVVHCTDQYGKRIHYRIVRVPLYDA